MYFYLLMNKDFIIIIIIIIIIINTRILRFENASGESCAILLLYRDLQK